MATTPLLGDVGTLLRRPYHDSDDNSSTRTCSVLCLFCRDLVGNLDKNERVSHLAFGYLRENCVYEFHDDLTKQCLRYLGDAANFDERQLLTTKELNEHWYRDDSCLCVSKRIIYIILAIIIVLFKDAAGIYVHQNYECPSTVASSKYSTLDLSCWLLTASVAHILFVALIMCALTPMTWAVGREVNWKWHQLSFSNLLRKAYALMSANHGSTWPWIPFAATPAIVLCWCFFVVWMALGFSICAELDTSERAQPCVKMVKYWLALQSVESFVLPCILLYISCKVFAWNFRDWTEKLCFVSILAAVLLLFVAKDVAALVVNLDNECDEALLGESDYVAFGVSTWMLGGSLPHLTVSVCTWIWWCVASFNVTDLMEVGPAGTLCLLMIPWCFFFAWTVIGFLLFSEMDGDTDCAKMTLSWSVIEAVEVLLPCLACIVSNMDGVNWWLLVQSFCALSVFAAKDIAALLIVSSEDCDAELQGGSGFVSFGVNTWMLAGSASHAAICGGLFMFAVVDALNSRPGEWLCAAMDSGCTALPWLFYIAWSVIGFLLYSEMDSHASCSKMTLSWSIIEGVEVVAVCLFVFVID